MARRATTGRREFITGEISGAALACMRVQPWACVLGQFCFDALCCRRRVEILAKRLCSLTQVGLPAAGRRNWAPLITGIKHK